LLIHHVILDRDGVLNREAPDGGWIHSAQDWVWEEGAVDGLRLLSDAGIRLSVATNQSGVGRGFFPSEAVAEVHDHMIREAARLGARVDAVFLCPHAPEDGCDCRKPAPGLLLSAVEASGVPIAETVAIGDAPRDIEAARGAGVRAMLVRTGKGRATEAQLGGTEVPVYDDLRSAALAIVRERNTQPPEGSAQGS
jgi:D-glycero-D-manno-heptose 1,7-bisphosphate phosphatase